MRGFNFASKFIYNYNFFMMKKFFMTAVCLLAASGCFAQFSTENETSVNHSAQTKVETDKYAVVTNRFWNNWFVSAGGGAALYFGDRADEMKFMDRPFGTFNLSVGKWFTPGIGVRLNGQLLLVKTTSTVNVHSNQWYDQSKELYKQKFDAFNTGGDVMFNLSNLFFGYNSKRFYNLIPYAGVGILFTRNKPRDSEMSLNAGLLNTFRLCSKLDLNLDVRGIMFDDRFNGDILGKKNDGMLSVSLGLTYKLGRIGWRKAMENQPTCPDLRYTEAQMAEIRSKMNDLQNENTRLAQQQGQQRIDTVRMDSEHTEYRVAPVMVVFRIGQATLYQDMRAVLGLFAQRLKEMNIKGRYIITGYTDKSGGIVINEKLANKRAIAVFDCLTREFGLDSSLFKMERKVGVDNMFYNNPALNRVTIIRAEK